MICFYYGLTAFAATWYFRHEARIDTTDPEYGSGGAIFGLGAVFMVFWQLRAPEFFRGEVLKRDTPALVVEE